MGKSDRKKDSKKKENKNIHPGRLCIYLIYVRFLWGRGSALVPVVLVSWLRSGEVMEGVLFRWL